MDLLKEKILSEGKVLNNEILKVDSFINHQVDCNLIQAIGEDFANFFKEKNITKVVTIESSGIAPAFATAFCLNVPLVIFKKQTSKILDNNLLQTEVHSFTKGTSYELTVSSKYLAENDNILFIDDFLANGEAGLGVYRLVTQANANLIGIGIVIEKSFQPGRKKLEDLGLDIYSLARIKSFENNSVQFLDCQLGRFCLTINCCQTEPSPLTSIFCFLLFF